MHKIGLLLFLLLLLASLGAQETLALNGLNEMQYVYRTAEDSLNTYFRDSFAFNLGYRNFSFGLKFIAELPKYRNDQSQLLNELDSKRLSLGWKELYASYAKDAYTIHAGTIEETFGNGIVFRSYQDLEMDEDNRVTGFRFGYDDKLRLKALYSGFDSPNAVGKLDLAYGLDLEYPVLRPLTLGASFATLQTLIGSSYRQDDVLGGRAKLQAGVFDAALEYAQRDKKQLDETGTALYASSSVSLAAIQFGGAYKQYDKFNYYNHLQDLPLANHHNETLADSQASGFDEEGWQAWTTLAFLIHFTLNLDYAEAWNADGDMRMNDAYAAVDWFSGATVGTLSYTHLEKVDDRLRNWQKEYYPGFSLNFPAWGRNILLSGEFKTVEKQYLGSAEVDGVMQDVIKDASHYEPKLQMDLSLGKLALSVGAQSWWEEVSNFYHSRYWPNLEAKYPILDGTELVLFLGKEAGGKVCRNGLCRYVAPFSGVRLELNTRF